MQRERLAPILHQHGVQLVLAGDDHHYERMHPQHGVAYVGGDLDSMIVPRSGSI